MLDALQITSQSQTAAASAPQHQATFNAASSGEQEWFEQLLAAATMDSPGAALAGTSGVQWPVAANNCSSTTNEALINQQQQLLLQLQAAGLQNGAFGLLSAPAAQLPHPLVQHILQLQQQQQQQQQQAQQLNAALTLAALGAHGGPCQANNLLTQQLLLTNPAAAAAAAAAGLWPQQQANLAATPVNSLSAFDCWPQPTTGWYCSGTASQPAAVCSAFSRSSRDSCHCCCFSSSRQHGPGSAAVCAAGQSHPSGWSSCQ